MRGQTSYCLEAWWEAECVGEVDLFVTFGKVSSGDSRAAVFFGESERGAFCVVCNFFFFWTVFFPFFFFLHPFFFLISSKI